MMVITGRSAAKVLEKEGALVVRMQVYWSRLIHLFLLSFSPKADSPPPSRLQHLSPLQATNPFEFDLT